MPCNTAGCLATSGRPPPPDEPVAGSYSPAARSASPSLRAAVLLPSDSECSPRSERCPINQRLGVPPSLRAAVLLLREARTFLPPSGGFRGGGALSTQQRSSQNPGFPAQTTAQARTVDSAIR